MDIFHLFLHYYCSCDSWRNVSKIVINILHRKLHRKYPSEQIEINIIQQSIEGPIDALKVHVDKLI